MAIAIELWSEGRLVDGMEQWWDDYEGWLGSIDGERRYPRLSQVDPYGFMTIQGDDIHVLLSELQRALSQVLRHSQRAWSDSSSSVSRAFGYPPQSCDS